MAGALRARPAQGQSAGGGGKTGGTCASRRPGSAPSPPAAPSLRVPRTATPDCLLLGQSGGLWPLRDPPCSVSSPVTAGRRREGASGVLHGDPLLRQGRPQEAGRARLPRVPVRPSCPRCLFVWRCCQVPVCGLLSEAASPSSPLLPALAKRPPIVLAICFRGVLGKGGLPSPPRRRSPAVSSPARLPLMPTALKCF